MGLGEAKYDMLRRWLLKLGVVCIAGFIGSGAALASEDSVPPDTSPGTTASQSNVNDVKITTSGNAQVQVSSTSSQSTGPTVSGSGGDSGTSTNDSAGSASILSAPSSITTRGSSEVNVGSPVTSVGLTHRDATASVVPSNDSVASIRTKEQALLSIVFSKAVALRALESYPIGQVPQTATAVRTANTPNTPPNPTGLLGDMRSLLTSSLIPALKSLSGGLVGTFVSSITLLSALLALWVLLLITASLLLIDFYLARLRRSGYTDAARSDVGAATLFFATPPKMGYISVPIT